MIITCQECDTSFDLNENLLQPTGSKVRCSKCNHVFVVYPPEAKATHEKPAEDISETAVKPEELEEDTLRDFDAGDLDLKGEPEPESTSEETVEDAIDDLDLGELDLELESEPKAAAEESVEDLDLGDLDLELEAEPEDIAEETDSDLDLGDLGIETDVEAEPEAVAEEASEDLDLGDLELNFDAEPEETADKAVDDLDLDDLGIETDVEAEAVAEEAVDDLDLKDLELSLDEAPEKAPEEAVDDLDLDDLGIETDVEAEPEAVAEEAADDLDLEDLELSLDEAPEKVQEEAVEDLDLDDLGIETDVEAEAVAEETVDDLDLEDLELGLDEAPEKAPEEAVEDLDLGDLGIDADVEAKPAAVAVDEPDELDISDIEEMLDEAETAEAEGEPEEVDLEFDLDQEPELETPAAEVSGAELEEAEAAELSELEKMLDVEEAVEGEDKITLDDFELEMAVDEKEVPSDKEDIEVLEFDEIDEAIEEPLEEGVEVEFDDAIAVAEPAEAATPKADLLYMDTQVLEPSKPEKVIEEKKEEKPVPVKKKRISMPVIAGLVVVLLAGAAFGTLTMLNQMNIRIPFISDLLFKPKIEDFGNLKIIPLEVKGEFVENNKTGTLFVISGQVKNDYPDSRRFIKITGKIYTKGKVLVKAETVFCGNVLSDTEIANFDIPAINKRLMNRAGDKMSNMAVQPGKAIPFMIVFSKLPDNLDEYSVEVAESSGS